MIKLKIAITLEELEEIACGRMLCSFSRRAKTILQKYNHFVEFAEQDIDVEKPPTRKKVQKR